MEFAEPQPIHQAAAVPYRLRNGSAEFCLITTIRKGLWGIPKGIIDPGETAEQTALKEAEEEASIPRPLAERARPVGALIYVLEREQGLRDDVLFLYDLELPADFVPVNQDGEVEFFELWPIADVMARVRDTDDFKFNVALVNIDFFLRHGLLDPDAPGYLQIVEGLYAGDRL